MDLNTIPTKANLIKSKERLEFSKSGFELLDKKRNVLIQEMMSLVEDAKAIQSKIDNGFKEAYDSLQMANITMGVNSVEEFAVSINKEEAFDILLRSVMGVEIPDIQYNEREPRASYGFFRTNPAFDRAVFKFNELKYLIYQLSEIESKVYKLAIEIKKTRKRANALEKIQIPKYEKLVKEIEEVLEEKEREDFFRLKKIKDKKF
jgi:V/A-type H+-transporting ATPase subunit D